MKTFLTIFAAIVLAAAVVIGYLRGEAKYDAWSARLSRAERDLKGKEGAIASTQKELQTASGDDAKMFKDLIEEFQTSANAIDADIVTILDRKPFFALNNEELRLYGKAKQGEGEWRKTHPDSP